MADDHREQDLGEEADNPAEGGTRKDHAGTSAGTSGVAPGGAAVRRAEERVAGGAEGGPRDPLADVEHPTSDE